MKKNRVIIGIIALFALALSQSSEVIMAQADTDYVRPSAVAGSFYPESPAELAKTIAGQFAASPKPSITGRPIAIISPHAGYIYSGSIAARGFKILEGESFSKVIVISPSHFAGFRGVSAFAGTSYNTPLGPIPIDRQLTRAIAALDDNVQVSNVGHQVSISNSEHSLEVQLPFLQTTLGKFELIALMMGDQDIQTCESLGNTLAGAIGGRDDILIVASSDLSHFHNANAAKKLDSVLENHLREFDYKSLYMDLASGKTEACGGGPIVAAMIAAEKLGANSSEITGYANSGDVTGDNSSVVGYLSAILYADSNMQGKNDVYELNVEDNDAEPDNGISKIDYGLTGVDKQTLISIVCESIKSKFEKRDIVFPAVDSKVINRELGAFVTLKIDGHLRGCIGTFYASEPLYKIVANMAREAAFSDPRFTPLTKEEFKKIDIEISVLTPMKKIDNIESIEVGRDGIYIKKGYASGVLLPQVAVEYGWNRYQFLEQTCYKAGIAPDSYKDPDTEIFVFQANIFNEDRPCE